MNQLYDNYIICAIEELPQTQADFLQLKKKLSKKFQLPIPTNANLRDRYNQLVKAKKIERSVQFEKILLSRAVRTQSGVAVIAVLTKPSDCPGKCLYCPTEKGMPKSYLSNEPAVMRAIDSKFDPYLQVQNRLRSLELNGHATDKIELIVMGGTFSYFPKTYQTKFITQCFKAANDYPRKILNFEFRISKINEKLLREQKRNEKAKHRIIGLTLETRPDYIDAQEIENFRNLGCTRVELGVQSIYDDVLKLNKRGHAVGSTIEATKMLKDAGFKLNYHMMPGLLGSTPRRDFEMFRALFKNPDFQPDMLKIYPTVVMRDSELYTIWKKGNYKPLTDKQFEKMIIKIKNEAITPYVRIARLVRDVPLPSIMAGPKVSNLRQLVAHSASCPCIRCREVKNEYQIENKIVLDRIDYQASDGKEIFLQYVSPDPPRVDEHGVSRVEAGKQKLFALLRLRIPKENNHQHFLKVLRSAALIREVHTYGKLAKIDSKDKNSPQHIGLGKKLLLEAERIAKEEFGLKKIVVISGVGVRGYYRKNGYRLKDTYMVKDI